MRASKPLYDNHYARWLKQFGWTHVLTLARINERDFGFPGRTPSLEQGRRYATSVATFFYRLGERVFGRNGGERVAHATFFENTSRRGTPTHYHCHSVLMLPDTHVEKAEIEIGRQWARLTDDGSHRLDRTDDNIGGIDGATRYVTKFSHQTDLPILMHLPGNDFIVPGMPRQDYLNQ